jgi:hypothetical protein
MPDDFTPDDALDAVAHLARSLDRVATSSARAAGASEQTLVVVTDLARTLRRTLPLAWLCTAIALFTLAFVAWSTVQLVREGRVHHERMQRDHQVQQR